MGTGDFTNDINSLGVVAADGIVFESGQTTDAYVGFFYSPGQTNVEATGKFAGTIISGVVNWVNVPDVFQVPNLEGYLPLAIPGGANVFRLTQREWRRVY